MRQLPLRFIHTSNRSLATPITRISLYGLVGIGAAIVHAGVLLALGLLMPLWAANPLAFLAASMAVRWRKRRADCGRICVFCSSRAMRKMPCSTMAISNQAWKC